MQIHTLTFCNLNSLQGRWTVDFTAPAFRASGIFAITGPTGAGKSTILDAICLALYGQTPRLNRITRNDNEIMSRQTGECSAEVTFSCSEGTFTCKWYQHRARKKKDGQLANAKHELSDSGGRLLAEKLSEVPGVVEKLTGLSFGRFTRSVLLAQGEFSAFLGADANERAPILEQITGTEIYSDISVAVHERYRSEADKLTGLQQHDASVQLLDEDSRAQKEAELVGIQQTLHTLTEKQKTLNEAISWWVKMAAMEENIRTLTRHMKDVSRQQEVFQPQRQRLHLAKRAETLGADHTALSLKRADVQALRASLQSIDSQLPDASDNVSRCTAACQLTKERLTAAREAQERDRVLRRQVGELDIQLAEIEKKSGETGQFLQKQRRHIESLTETLNNTGEQIRKLQDVAARSGEYLKNHAWDEHLESAIEPIETRIADVASLDGKLEALRMALTQTVSRLQDAESQGARFEKEWSTLKDRQKTLQRDEQNQLAHVGGLLDGITLKGYRAQLDALLDKRLLTRQIVSLESERERLRDGAPCPLCGALAHPYVMGQVPELDAVEREVAALQQRMDAIEYAERELANLRKALGDSEKALQMATFQQEKAGQQAATHRESVARLEQEQESVRRDRERLWQQLQERLAGYGVSEIDLGQDSETVRLLKARAAKWKQAALEVAQCSIKVQELQLIQKETDGAMAAARNSLDENEKRLAGWSDEKAELWRQRLQMYGEKSIAAEEARWNDVVTRAEAAVQTGQNQLQHAKTEETRLLTRREGVTQALDEGLGECTTREAAFQKKCEDSGFGDEAGFLAAQIEQGELARLAEEALQLDDREKSVKTLLADQTRQREELKRHPRSEADEAELRAQLAEVNTRAATLSETLGALRQTLTDDALRRKEKGQLMSKLAAQQETCARWARLHELIGSADGKKYRNFAQGLTFERLISQSNHQLVRMTDRYLLLPDAMTPLAFSVVDNHQAGEVRSTRNLSGGETFLVSLALALGLAQMAGKTVRIDSLFLDEGFGTLDDQALETALDALGTLHHEGKLIGIISHVPALKERIACQIQVIPESGGISTLLGPGCSGGNVNEQKK